MKTPNHKSQIPRLTKLAPAVFALVASWTAGAATFPNTFTTNAEPAALAADRTWTGSNYYSGPVIATNPTNVFAGNGAGLTNVYVSHFTIFMSTAKVSAGAVTFVAMQGGGSGTLATEDVGCLGVVGTLTNFTYRIFATVGAPILSTTNLTFRFYTNLTVVTPYNYTINGSTAMTYVAADTTHSWYNGSVTNTLVLGVSNSAANSTANLNLLVGFDIVR